MVFLSKLYVHILINDHQFWSQNLDKKCPGCGVRIRRRDLKRLLFPGPGCEDPGWGKRNLITFIHQYVKAACSLHNIQYMYWPGINKEAGFRIQWFYLLSVKFLRGSIFFFITRMESSCLIYTEGTKEIIIRSMAVFHSDMNKSCLSFLDLEIVEI